MSGLETTHWRTAVIDVLLEHLLRGALADAPACWHDTIAILALGGYGRRELCPFSDIDVMFLYDDTLPAAELSHLQERITDRVLYPLWDLKLKVGHASRTIPETLEAARSDPVTLNALVEARHIAGSPALFSTFLAAQQEALRNTGPAALARFLLAEQASRHEKFGGSLFVQEPEIKNGVGGLRDYHTLCWVARLLFHAHGPAGLVAQNFLTTAEGKSLENAYSFLLRIRNELHFESTRATEILNLEKQITVASALHYPGSDWVHQVETLMRDYFRAAETIRQVARAVEWRFAQTLSAPAQSHSAATATLFDGFSMANGYLSAAAPDVFDHDPVRLLRVFRNAQQYRVTPDFPLLRLVREKTVLLTPRIARSSQAIHCFFAILADAGHVGDTLTDMHEAGVLTRFLPEFEGLRCLVQREIFHRYTADVHTLLCLRELDAIFLSSDPERSRYRTALLETDEPALLYLVLLLHDIGKQFGIADHAETGAHLAEKILRRLGIAPKARTLVTRLIHLHLAMAEFWRKHDLDEPANIERFAELTSSESLLRYLYVLTYCDAKATAPDLWNSYKNALHSQLFLQTLAHFERSNSQHSQDHLSPQDMLRREIVEKGLIGEDITSEELDAHFALVPDRYFQQYGPEDTCLHIRMVNKLLFTITSAHGAGSLSPVIHWQDNKTKGISDVTIVTWDRAGLFYKIAGAFSVAGLNILGAKAIARSDHIAIDTFHIEKSIKDPLLAEELRDAFSHTLDEALVQERDLEPAIRAQILRVAKRPRTAREKLLAAVPVKSKVSVYHDAKLHRTVVELSAGDRIGLLFFLGRLFYRHHLDIAFARITTENNAAVDTFYLEPFPGEADKTPAELKSLRDDIKTCLAESPV